MLIISLAALALTALLSILVLTWRLRPRSLRIKATLTHWASLEVELTDPQNRQGR